MTDRPILFSGSMVRSLIAECKKPGAGKTQTRRVLKAQVPPMPSDEVVHRAKHERPYLDAYAKSPMWCWWTRDDRCCLPQFDVGYAVEDSLWVRETWADDEQFGGVLYRADNPDADPIGNGWRPSIFMPRKHSRLTLSVTDVRVQRLQEISEDDAKAEGADKLVMEGDGEAFYLDNEKGTYRCGFAGLWEHINGKRPERGWDDNPFVVAVTFKPELRNIDAPVREIAA